MTQPEVYDATGLEPTPKHVAATRPRWKEPAWLLALIVLGSFVVWGGAAALSKSPWIFVDELIYAELARSIADGSQPALRGVPTHAFGVVYPALIAPAWWASSTVTAYHLIHVINAFVLSLVAVPAYWLARRFVNQKGALTVAAFSVLVPSMAYAATVLTEVAFYPLFVLAVAALARALDTTSSRDQLLALAAIVVAAATKVLAVALIGAGVLAIVVLAVLARAYDGAPLRESLRRFRTTLLSVTGAAVALAALSFARGRSPFEWFGVYGEAIQHLHPTDIPLAFVRHLAVLSLYTAVIPLAAATVLVVIGFRRAADTRIRAFTVLMVSVIVCTTFSVSVFAAYASSVDFETTGTPAASPLYERNLFSVCPLLLVALALWIERGLPRPRYAGPAAAAGSALLMIVYPWNLVPRAANPQDLAPIFLSAISRSNVLLASIAFALAAVAALAFLKVDREDAGVLWVVVGSWFVVVGFIAVVIFSGASRHIVRTSGGVPFDWVDRAVGADARVTVLWNESGTREFARPSERQRVVWVGEFFNRSIARVSVLGPALPFGLIQTRVRAAPDGTVTDLVGAPMRASFVLAKCTLGVRAPVVARDRKTRMALYRVGGTVVLGRPSPDCASP